MQLEIGSFKHDQRNGCQVETNDALGMINQRWMKPFHLIQFYDSTSFIVNAIKEEKYDLKILIITSLKFHTSAKGSW